ncbi:MAG: hypothetical protein ACJA08_003441 [Cyclobacteriaceae bacterium]|jgi:hypothetical protein
MIASFKSVLSQFLDTRVYNLYISIAKESGKHFIDGDNRRVICTFSDNLRIQTSLMPWPEGYFILINQKLKNNLGIELGDEVAFMLDKDHSDYGMVVPDELLVLLDQDDLGSKYFHQMTPGKQRSLIYIVNQVKNPDSRMNKSLAIVDHLKESEGKLDSEQLNIKIKEYNQRGRLNF